MDNNIAYVEEQWVEREQAVYHRVRFDGGEWSPWGKTPDHEIPFVIRTELALHEYSRETTR